MRTGEIRILPCRRLAAAGPPKVQQAQALLQAQLADGPKSGAQVEAAALEASIPERVLIAAADSLGVRTQRGQWWLP